MFLLLEVPTDLADKLANDARECYAGVSVVARDASLYRIAAEAFDEQSRRLDAERAAAGKTRVLSQAELNAARLAAAEAAAGDAIEDEATGEAWFVDAE